MAQMSAVWQGCGADDARCLPGWTQRDGTVAWHTRHSFVIPPPACFVPRNSSPMLIGSGTAYAYDRRQRGSGPRRRDLRPGGQRQLSRHHSPVCASMLSTITLRYPLADGRGAVPACLVSVTVLLRPVFATRAHRCPHTRCRTPTFGTSVQTGATLRSCTVPRRAARHRRQVNPSPALTPPP